MGASCCRQQHQDEESQTEIHSKHKYDPKRLPVKGALQQKKQSDDKKFVKFPTRVRQEADEKEQEHEMEQQVLQDDLAVDPMEPSENNDVQSHKRSLFSKQKSQFVKADE